MPSKNRIHVLPARRMPIATGTPITSVPKKRSELTGRLMASASQGRSSIPASASAAREPANAFPALPVDQHDHVIGQESEARRHRGDDPHAAHAEPRLGLGE